MKKFWQHCDMQAIYRKQKTGKFTVLAVLFFFLFFQSQVREEQ